MSEESKVEMEFSNDELKAMAHVLAMAHKASDISSSRTITHFLDKFKIEFKAGE